MTFIDQFELELIDLLPAAPTVVDVGACRGDFTAAVLELRPSARVFASEPQPFGQDLIRSRFDDRVTVVPGLWSERGNLDLFVDATAMPADVASFYRRSAMDSLVATNMFVGLPVTTLTDVCGEFGISRIDLLKMDCEGSEYEVLVGALPVMDLIHKAYWEYTTGNGRYSDYTLTDFRKLLDFYVLGDEDEVEDAPGIYYCISDRSSVAKPTVNIVFGKDLDVGDCIISIPGSTYAFPTDLFGAGGGEGIAVHPTGDGSSGTAPFEEYWRITGVLAVGDAGSTYQVERLNQAGTITGTTVVDIGRGTIVVTAVGDFSRLES